MTGDLFDTAPAFREAVLADARRQAERTIEAAESDANRRIEHARKEADELVQRARREGMEAAARETRRERAEVRRRARELVLGERRRALRRLRERVLQRLRAQCGTDAYGRLMGRLEQQARSQLGGEVTVEADDDRGGFVARSERRAVDYRLPALVDRVLDEMGAELEALWR